MYLNETSFKGIKGPEKEILDTSLSKALSSNEFYVLLGDPHFSVFVREIGECEKKLIEARKNKDKVLIEKYKLRLEILGLLDLNFSGSNSSGFTINEIVESVLSNGVSILIKKFKNDKLNLELEMYKSRNSLTEREYSLNYNNKLVSLIHNFLNKIDIETITGSQLLELGFLLKNVDKDIKEDPYFDYNNKNIPITAKDIEEAKEIILKRKNALSKSFSIAIKSNNIDYFKSMGGDLIRLGTIIDDLEQFIALYQLKDSYEISKVNKKELH